MRTRLDAAMVLAPSPVVKSRFRSLGDDVNTYVAKESSLNWDSWDWGGIVGIAGWLVGGLVGRGCGWLGAYGPASPGDHKGSPLRVFCSFREVVWLVETVWPRVTTCMPLRIGMRSTAPRGIPRSRRSADTPLNSPSERLWERVTLCEGA